MRWPWQQKTESRSLLSVSDPAFAAWIDVGPTLAGVAVTESSVLGISAVYRAVSLIAGTLAGLPLRTVREIEGTRTVVPSWLDNPAGPDGPTAYEWKETVYLHLLLHGNAYLMHRYNTAGALIGAWPIHPSCVVPEWALDDNSRPTLRKEFLVGLVDGRQVRMDESQLTHIPALCTDGLKGLSPITVARQSMGVTIAGDRSAARVFGDGALISGMVTTDAEDEVDDDDAKLIEEQLARKVSGHENAGRIPFINRKLKFHPWTMTAADAQFLQSRQFQIEEVARWYGVPPHLLAQTEKQTSWGTGVAEQNRGLARTVLGPWDTRVSQRLDRLLPPDLKPWTDFQELERPTPEADAALSIQLVATGIMTPNEARKRQGLSPIAGGDTLRQPTVNSQAHPLDSVPV